MSFLNIFKILFIPLRYFSPISYRQLHSQTNKKKKLDKFVFLLNTNEDGEKKIIENSELLSKDGTDLFILDDELLEQEVQKF
jgi:hypothetical protein